MSKEIKQGEIEKRGMEKIEITKKQSRNCMLFG